MIIACTKRFFNDLSDIIKKPKDRYNNCLTDILSKFEGKPISTISLMDSSLDHGLVEPGCSYRKIRIPNSLQEEGTRGGFRLFCVCFIKGDAIILLHIYPKTGRLAGSSPSHKDLVTYIEEMKIENGDYYILNLDKIAFEKQKIQELDSIQDSAF